MAIDIGNAATDRGSAYTMTNVTYVTEGNPANANGSIDTVEIWPVSELSNVDVATFFVISGDNLSTRDLEAIGTVTSGSKQTFSGLDMDTETGDYIGLYSAGGSLEADAGVDKWFKSSDWIPCTNVAFTSSSFLGLGSIYGTGTESGAGWANKFNGVANANIGKINGVAVGAIVRVNGVA